jgi:hypothetical protein
MANSVFINSHFDRCARICSVAFQPARFKVKTAQSGAYATDNAGILGPFSYKSAASILEIECRMRRHPDIICINARNKQENKI